MDVGRGFCLQRFGALRHKYLILCPSYSPFNPKQEKIMARYIMQEMPDTLSGGKNILYPHMIIEGQVDLYQLVEAVSRGTTFAAEEVMASVRLLTDAMIRFMAQGYSVKIDGLGSFTPSLGFRRGVEREESGGTQRNASSIEVDGLIFRPDRRAILDTNAQCRLQRERAVRYTRPGIGRDERLAAAHEYLRQFGFMSISQYVKLTGMSRTSAQRELKYFLGTHQLGSRGHGAHSRYVLPGLPAEESTP